MSGFNAMKTIIMAAIASLTVSTAFGHALLDRASPAVGSEVSGSPPVLSLTYTEPVEPLFSTIKVTNSAGGVVDKGKLTARDGGRVLSVELKSLPPGVYTVDWHVTSVDTHKTAGHFMFTVKP